MFNLDSNASKKPFEKVLDKFNTDIRKYFYNPSNTTTKQAIEENFKINKIKLYLLKNFGFSDEDNIIFTSGATESNSTVINYIIKLNDDICITKKKRIVYDTFAHSSITKKLKKKKFNDFIMFDSNIDNINESDHINAIQLNLSIELSNKELTNVYLKSEPDVLFLNAIDSITGRIIPYDKIFKKIKEQNENCLCVLDFSQNILLNDLKKKTEADIITFSGYKYGALPGTGCIICKKNIHISPLIYGVQQNKIRGGTLNYSYIHSLKTGLKEKFIKYNDEYIKDIKQTKQQLCKKLSQYNIINNSDNFIDNVITLKFDHCTKKYAYILSNEYNINVGIGSACETEKKKKINEGYIRLSFDNILSDKQIMYIIDSIIKVIK